MTPGYVLDQPGPVGISFRSVVRQNRSGTTGRSGCTLPEGNPAIGKSASWHPITVRRKAVVWSTSLGTPDRAIAIQPAGDKLPLPGPVCRLHFFTGDKSCPFKTTTFMSTKP